MGLLGPLFGALCKTTHHASAGLMMLPSIEVKRDPLEVIVGLIILLHVPRGILNDFIKTGSSSPLTETSKLVSS